MKKWIACWLAVLMLGMSVGQVSAINENRGGLMGFVAGCCFGIRAAGEYNEGKEIHWREWICLIPYISIVFAIWNGVDGANGFSTKDYAKKYGSTFY